MICVVVSARAPQGTPEHERAEEVHELLVLPALERFAYELRPSAEELTQDSAAELREAELCIVDLTDADAAVAYQAGCRHESGRPTLHLIRAGSEPPLALPERPQVVYDLSSARGLHRARLELQRLVEAAEAVGAPPPESSVSAALERLEEKLDRLLARQPQDDEPLEDQMRSPQEAFMAAIAGGDIGAAGKLLPRLREAHVGVQDLLAAAGLVAAAGSTAGADVIRDVLRERGAELPSGVLEPAVSALVRYQLRAPREPEADELVAFLQGMLAGSERPPIEQAFLHNQLHLLLWGAGQIDGALGHALHAAELNPDNVSYHYNLSLIYLRLGRLEDAERAVDAYMADEQSRTDADRLLQAIELYLKRGRPDDARAAYEALAAADPERAKVIRGLDGDLRRALGD